MGSAPKHSLRQREKVSESEESAEYKRGREEEEDRGTDGQQHTPLQRYHLESFNTDSQEPVSQQWHTEQHCKKWRKMRH